MVLRPWAGMTTEELYYEIGEDHLLLAHGNNA